MNKMFKSSNSAFILELKVILKTTWMKNELMKIKIMLYLHYYVMSCLTMLSICVMSMSD